MTTPLSEYSVVTLADPGPDGVAGTGDETGTVLTASPLTLTSCSGEAHPTAHPAPASTPP